MGCVPCGNKSTREAAKAALLTAKTAAVQQLVIETAPPSPPATPKLASPPRPPVVTPPAPPPQKLEISATVQRLSQSEGPTEHIEEVLRKKREQLLALKRSKVSKIY